MSANVNTTTNGTQPLSCINPTAEKIGSTVAYCLIFAVSLAGNIFIGIIVYKTKTMRTPINFLIVNMAMSDLLYPIFLFPRALTGLYVGSWLISSPLGQALCKLCNYLERVSMTVSIQSLVLIAVDRFGAVVFPLRSPVISSKLCPFFILATWIVAMATRSPVLFAMKLAEHPGMLTCEEKWNEAFGESSSFENYTLAIIIVFFCTPTVMIAILYTIMYSKLNSQTIPGEQSANARQQREKRERNVLKMAIAIVLGFTLCWLPNSIGSILIFRLTDKWRCGFQHFHYAAYFIAIANCAINPCICFIFSGKYRQELKYLLRCF